MGLTRITAQQISNIDYKQSVRAVATTNITLTGGAPNVVDGVNLSTNNRILVTGQTTASQNGLYYVTTVGAGSTGTWTRSTDGDTTGEIDAGMIVMVTEGTVYADTQWKLITDDPITVGTTALTFVQNYSTNSISAGTSNVAVITGGNVTVSSAGTPNVFTISSTGVVVSGTESVTGNTTAGNILTGGLISATGTISSGSTISTSGTVIAATSLQTTGQSALYASAAQNDIIGTSKTTGTILIGGAAQTGTIQVGSSTANQFLVLAGGATGSGNTKTIQIGQTGAAGSATNITVGPSAGVGAANFGSGTTVLIANIGATAFTVNGTASLDIFKQGTAGTLLTNNQVTNDQYSTGKTTATVTLGGAQQTGAIFLGQTNSANSNLFIQSANLLSGFTKNITIGGNGQAGSGMALNIGPASAAGTVANTTFSTGTTVAIANTSTLALSVAGNITGSYFFGNGSQLTGIAASYGNANVVANLAALGTNPISTAGNITGGNVIAAGNLYTNGNVLVARTLSVGTRTIVATIYLTAGGLTILTRTGNADVQVNP